MQNLPRAQLKAKSSSIFTPDLDPVPIPTSSSNLYHEKLHSKPTIEKRQVILSISVMTILLILSIGTVMHVIHSPVSNSIESSLFASSNTKIIFQTESRSTQIHSSHSHNGILYKPFSNQEQEKFLEQHGNECFSQAQGSNHVWQRYKSMSNQQLQRQLFKYCVLYIHGGGFLEEDTSAFKYMGSINSLDAFLAELNSENKLEKESSNSNIAILSSEGPYIHDGFIYFSLPKSEISQQMISYLLSVKDDIVIRKPHFLLEYLYSLIQNELEENQLTVGWKKKHTWKLLDLRCDFIQSNISPHESTQKIVKSIGSPLPQNYCPKFNGNCCSIYDTSTSSTPLLVTRHPLPPLHLTFPTHLHDIPLPYAYESNPNLRPNPYIATLREITYQRPQQDIYVPTQRMFDFLFENDCLPSEKGCHKCLRSWSPTKGSCENCMEVCQCYCQVLCKYRPEEPFISKDIWITLPKFRKDSDRLIPKMIHQTWFESVTIDKYPNMSRLIKSWETSGWEYKFYDDDASAEFLSTHFPDEVRQAYDALIPGAFKADLFRYCVLLIHGGIYADMDVLLESNLDLAIPPDVGFIVPIDEPGIEVNHRMCLWNGLLAVAPGHPILVKAIEMVVNNIRNRFTSVDYDDMFCPTPVFSVSHMVDMLFTAGPCILGAALNDVLGHHMQDEISIGELDIWNVDLKDNGVNSSADKFKFKDPRLFLPGRAVILQQGKDDMGAHRFTLNEKNMVVAATDLPDYEDRPNQESKHYSKTRVKAGIYGVEKLYKDNRNADERIRFFIEGM